MTFNVRAKETMMTTERLKLDWYLKRLTQNKRIKEFLISKIVESNTDLGMPIEELAVLNYEDLFELAVACVNKSISITLGANKDYSDKSDAKFAISQFRNNNKIKGCWTNSISIKGSYCKEGPLRVCAYNTLADKFHFFFIPHSEFQHISKNGVIEIIIEQVNGCFYEPDFNGQPSYHRKWWQYEVETFEEMCNLKPGNVRKRSNKSGTVFELFFEAA
jgi:hypothetical protein